jgi:hypothetical protein
MSIRKFSPVAALVPALCATAFTGQADARSINASSGYCSNNSKAVCFGRANDVSESIVQAGCPGNSSTQSTDAWTVNLSVDSGTTYYPVIAVYQGGWWHLHHPLLCPPREKRARSAMNGAVDRHTVQIASGEASEMLPRGC